MNLNVDLSTQVELSPLRRKAVKIAEAGLRAADGGAALRRILSVNEDRFLIGDFEFPLIDGKKLIIIGGGKATLPIARVLEEALGSRIDVGAIVLRRDEAADSRILEVLHSDHPLPSPDSVSAAERVMEIASAAAAGDLVITCFTGGRSALLSLPPEGVSFEEKRTLNQMLVASGMPISEINTVRKHVSMIKGGRLAKQIAPARIVNLMVSDVAGDPMDVLADLTTQDSSTPAQAVEILRNRSLWSKTPASIREFLESPAAESPQLDTGMIDNVMLVNGEMVCEAMAAAAESLGFGHVRTITDLEGDATAVGGSVASALDLPGMALVGCGGETTVDLGDQPIGQGGPNQEAAIVAAQFLAGQQAVALFLDTDGSDGSTRYAGAIIGGDTTQRAQELGLDLDRALLTHQSSEPLKALHGLITTGPTGTNVNDLFVVLTENRKVNLK